MINSNSSLLPDYKIAKSYVLGGKGIFRLVSPTGNSVVYKVKKVKNWRGKDEGYYIFTKNGKSYDYMGIMVLLKDDKNGRVFFRSTEKSKVPTESPQFKGFQYIIDMLNNEKFFEASPMEIFHCGVCCICGRQLTDLESIQIGMGPICRGRHL